jgi:hypothetical protein
MWSRRPNPDGYVAAAEVAHCRLAHANARLLVEEIG